MIPIIGAIKGFFTTQRLVIGGIIVTAVVGLYIRDLHMRNEIQTLKNANQVLTLAKEQADKIIDQQKEDVDEIKRSNAKLIHENKVLTQSAKELEETLYRERKKKKSLEQLAIEAASKIEYRVNKASAEVLRCLEIASGSPMKENERETYNDCTLTDTD